MNILHPLVVRFARRTIPLPIYSRMAQVYKELFGRLQEAGQPGLYLQRMRSLAIHGIGDSLLHATIADYLEFNSTNYKPVNDAARVVGLIEAVIRTNELGRDIAECGVYQGSSARIIRHFADPERTVHLFDTFSGFVEQDRLTESVKGLRRDPGLGHVNTSLELARSRVLPEIDSAMREFKKDSVVFHVGPVQETLQEVSGTTFSLVHLDMDLYAPTRFALEFFIPRIAPRGIMLLNDYAVPESGYRGVFQAATEVDLDQMYGPLPFGDQSTAMFVKIE